MAGGGLRHQKPRQLQLQEADLDLAQPTLHRRKVRAPWHLGGAKRKAPLLAAFSGHLHQQLAASWQKPSSKRPSCQVDQLAHAGVLGHLVCISLQSLAPNSGQCTPLAGKSCAAWEVGVASLRHCHRKGLPTTSELQKASMVPGLPLSQFCGILAAASLEKPCALPLANHQGPTGDGGEPEA